MNNESASEGESEDVVEERSRMFGDLRSQRCLQNRLGDSAAESLIARTRPWDGEHSDANVRKPFFPPGNVVRVDLICLVGAYHCGIQAIKSD